MASGTYNEAPMLAKMVANGELPPVDERLPVEPMVLEVAEIGNYGGTFFVFATRRFCSTWCTGALPTGFFYSPKHYLSKPRVPSRRVQQYGTMTKTSIVSPRAPASACSGSLRKVRYES